MTDNEKFGGQSGFDFEGELLDPSDIRNLEKGTIVDIVRSHYAKATHLMIDSDSRESLMRCERALRTLEEELSNAMIDSDIKDIMAVRKEMAILGSPTKTKRHIYRNLLWKRLNVILRIMGRKRMLPMKNLEVMG